MALTKVPEDQALAFWNGMRDRDSTSSVLTLCPRPTELTEAATPPLSDARTSNRLIRMAQAPVSPRQSRSPPSSPSIRPPFRTLSCKPAALPHPTPRRPRRLRPGQEPVELARPLDARRRTGRQAGGGAAPESSAALDGPQGYTPPSAPLPPLPRLLSLWTAPAPQLAIRFIGDVFLPPSPVASLIPTRPGRRGRCARRETLSAAFPSRFVWPCRIDSEKPATGSESEPPPRRARPQSRRLSDSEYTEAHRPVVVQLAEGTSNREKCKLLC